MPRLLQNLPDEPRWWPWLGRPTLAAATLLMILYAIWITVTHP